VRFFPDGPVTTLLVTRRRDEPFLLPLLFGKTPEKRGIYMNAPEDSRLHRLDGQRLDLIVIGGGVIGAGIASDAAGRGLKVALFEKDDYASGTSSRSTRLIHGGLRYLEMFDFALVRQDLREREKLLHNAPHLVKPLPFLVPMYHKSLFYRLKMRIGMFLYDILSYDKSLPGHHFYSKQETLSMEPQLKPDRLNGSFMYYDAQVPYTERLVLENVVAAERKGAFCFNHVKVLDSVKQGSRITGVMVQDELTGEKREVSARLVINVSGPWLDPVDEELTDRPSYKVRKTKGIHFTAPTAPHHALVLFAEKDNRLFFLIPWLGYAWVGTTDTDFDDELESVHATREDVEYLRESVQEVFPKADWNTIYFTNAGVRSLVRKETRKGLDESAVSRKHAVVDYARKHGVEGYISVVGGKLTAYRDIAEDATNLVLKKLGLVCKSATSEEKLPGANFEGSFEAFTSAMIAAGSKTGLSKEQVDYLLSLYGSRIQEIFDLVKQDATLVDRLNPAYPDIKAQLKHAVEREQCLTLRDFMMHRSGLYFTTDQGQQAINAVVEGLAGLLGWNEARRKAEVESYWLEIAWSQEWQGKAREPQPVIA
jgi:glycerol-3-phosphate dehydrogenase